MFFIGWNRTTKSKPNLKLKTLLKKLAELEVSLQTFSYERLTAVEAHELKDSLEKFRKKLLQKIEANGEDAIRMASNTVHRIADETEKNKSEENANRPRIASGEDQATDFSGFYAHLTESQLSDINGILSAAEIATRISNDPIPPAGNDISESFKGFTASNKQYNTNAMSNTNKRSSETTKTSGQSKKAHAKFDLNPILEDCLGQKDLLEELIMLYKQNALEFIGQLKIHLQNLDFEAIRFASHKIKSGLRMLNTQELLVIAEQIELGSKTDQDIKQLNFLYDCFVKEYPEIERAIDEEFQKLN